MSRFDDELMADALTRRRDPLATFRGPDGELDTFSNIEHELDLADARAEAVDLDELDVQHWPACRCAGCIRRRA